MRSTTTLMLAASFLAISACAKKPPKELPPAPVDTTGPVTTDTSSGAVLPGSQEDFVATVSSDRIFFDTDSSDVDGTDQTTLQSQATWLSKYAEKRITVEGHADERGTREYNLRWANVAPMRPKMRSSGLASRPRGLQRSAMARNALTRRGQTKKLLQRTGAR